MAPRPIELKNPFVVDMGKETQHNLLGMMDHEDIDHRLENIIIAAVDCYRAEHKTNYKDIVNKHMVFQLFKHCDVLTAVAVQEFTGCAKRQSQQYIAVMKTAIIFIDNVLKFPLSNNTGYVDISKSQIKAGRLLWDC